MARLPGIRVWGLLFALTSLGCGTPGDRTSGDQAHDPGVDTSSGERAAARYLVPTEVHMGQTIYVPIYSSILFFDDRQTRELSAMLTIHNIDLDWQIEISRVDYYNTKGQYLRSYLREPRALAPLETITFVVEEMDRTGGVGANFIVVWQAPNEVSAPLVEAVMIGSGSLGNVSLITSGKVIRTFGTHHTPK